MNQFRKGKRPCDHEIIRNTQEPALISIESCSVVESIGISTGFFKIPIAFQVIPFYIGSARIFPFISYKEPHEQIRLCNRTLNDSTLHKMSPARDSSPFYDPLRGEFIK